MEVHERQLVLDQLTASRARLLELVDGMAPEQCSYHPADGRWSIAECLEHVIRVETRVLGLIAKKLSDGPSEPEKRSPSSERDEKDALLTRIVPDRTTRREAPEPARPTGQWANSNELLAEFQKTRQRTTEFAAASQDDLRSYFMPHMAFGELDCYQWLIVLSLHGSRHAQQIEEIKATAGFPRFTAAPASS